MRDHEIAPINQHEGPSTFTDPAYLLDRQYRDASNLDARVRLHVRFSTNRIGWNRWVFDRFNLPSPCRILELGCGPAALWRENLERIPAGWDITLTDFSPGMVKQARQNLRDSERPFTLDVVDARSIPYDEASFDVVIANHMLYHVPDVAETLAGTRRVLRIGGKLYASTVGEEHMKELFELVRPVDPQQRFRRPVASFSLENGAGQLVPWFSQITLYLYRDSLVITETDPLIAYLLSMAEAEPILTSDELAQLVAHVERELTTHGPLHVTKRSGLFEATRTG